MPEGTEQVLQFGEGNFLRAFVGLFYRPGQRADRLGDQVVAVQPIALGECEDINHQDGLYTVYLRGLENGGQVIPQAGGQLRQPGLKPLRGLRRASHCSQSRPTHCQLNTTEAVSRLTKFPVRRGTAGFISGQAPGSSTSVSCFKGEAGRGW